MKSSHRQIDSPAESYFASFVLLTVDIKQNDKKNSPIFTLSVYIHFLYLVLLQELYARRMQHGLLFSVHPSNVLKHTVAV